MRKQASGNRKKCRKYPSLKSLVLFTGLVVVVASLSVGLYQKTYASLTDHDEKQNDFRVGGLQTSVEEDFEPPFVFEPDKKYTKRVWVANTGDLDSFIRVLALPVLSKKQGNGGTILLPTTVNGSQPVLTIDYNLSDWVAGEDGYFYYKKKVASGEKTAVLFSQVILNQLHITEEYQGVQLSFEIKAEGIGTSQYAYRDAWWNGQMPTAGKLLEIDNLLKNQTANE